MFLSRRGWAVVAVIVGIGLQGFIWKLDQEKAALFANGETVQAELLHVAVTQDGVLNTKVLRAVFRFQTDARTVIAQTVINAADYGSVAIGDVVDIGFIPRDPEQIEFAVGASAETAKTSFWRLVLVAVFGIGFLAFLAIRFKTVK